MEQETQPAGSLTKRPEVTHLSWQAPIRPFKKRDKDFFTTIIAIAVLIGLIMFFLEGILPVAVVIAIVFLVYVLSTVPPETVEHSITNKGIIFAGTKKRWDEFSRFWFTRRFDSELLVLEGLQPGTRLELVIQPEQKREIQRYIEDYLPHEETAPNFLDRAALWFSKRVPLEG